MALTQNFRYEIHIEAVNPEKSMIFPIKKASLLREEFSSAVNMASAENFFQDPSLVRARRERVFKRVTLFDKAKNKIVEEAELF